MTITQDDTLQANVVHVKGDLDALDLIARRRFQTGNKKWTSPPSNPGGASLTTAQTTASTTYVDLATIGPSVTLTTGSSVMVTFTSTISNTVAGGLGQINFAVSGATTLAPSALTAPFFEAGVASQFSTVSGTYLVSVNPGVNTFTMKYTAGANGGTATFLNRSIAVVPI